MPTDVAYGRESEAIGATVDHRALVVRADLGQYLIQHDSKRSGLGIRGDAIVGIDSDRPERGPIRVDTQSAETGQDLQNILESEFSSRR